MFGILLAAPSECVPKCGWILSAVCVQERVQAVELWQTAAQKLDHLQQLYQKTISDGQIYDAQRQQLKVQYSQINIQSQHFIRRICLHH